MVKAPAGRWFMADVHDKGKWVKYSDHAKAIEAKDKEIERLKGALEAINQDIYDPHDIDAILKSVGINDD